MIGDILYHELKGKLTVSKKKYRRLGNKSVEVAVDEDGKEHELDGTEIPYEEYEAKEEKKSTPRMSSDVGFIKGEPGADADEDYIIEAVIPRVLEQIRQPEDGKDGADADTELIIREMLPLVLERMPKPKEIDEVAVIQKVISRIRIPQDGTPGLKGKDGSPDTPGEIKEKLETLKGDDRLDAKAIKNLPKTQIGGGHGPNSLKHLEDVTITNPTDNQSLTYDSATGKWVNETVTGGSHDAVTLAGEDFLSLTGQQITANPIDLDNLSATGTPSVTTFLRGDNTWATPSSSGGIVRTVTTSSGAFTAGGSAGTDYVYLIAGAHAVALPTAVSNTNRYTFKNNHSAAITITPDGVETVEGAANIQVAPEDSVDLISNNANWFVI